MHAFYAMLGARERTSAVRLVSGGTLHASASVARAQVSAAATTLAADNSTWETIGADAARFYGAPRHLLIEPQRSNGNRNPRAEFGTTPSFPTTSLPTHWSNPAPAGLTVQALGVETQAGIPCLRLRASGTATSGNLVLEFETQTQIAAAPSQTWTESFFLRVADAPLPPTGYRFRIVGRTAAGAAVTGNVFNSAVFAPDGTLRRYERAETLTSDASIARVVAGVQASLTAGQAYDFTIDIGWPQIEQGGTAATPILPPIGSPQATTRGADLVTFPLGSILPAGRGTIVLSGLLPALGPANTLLQLHDGTDQNRFLAVAAAGAVSLLRSLAGAEASVAAGSIAAGAPFRLALAFDGGRAAMSLNGAAAVAVTGGPTAGLTTLRAGTQSAGAAALNGLLTHCVALPHVTADAALPGLALAAPA